MTTLLVSDFENQFTHQPVLIQKQMCFTDQSQL